MQSSSEIRDDIEEAINAGDLDFAARLYREERESLTSSDRHHVFEKLRPSSV